MRELGQQVRQANVIDARSRFDAAVPAKLCDHGIDASRRCSICIEDKPRRGSLTLHTAGELHPMPVTRRMTFTFNLSDLLDDPARKLPANLVELDGTDARVEDFVFATEGAQELYADMAHAISRQLERGKDIDVMIMCRGGRHRSVAFGENLASHFGAPVTHHHKHLDIVRTQG